MNQASNEYDLGYKVYQKKHDWYIEYRGRVYSFYSTDMITLERTNEVPTTKRVASSFGQLLKERATK